ncbi:MAG: P-type conjugative transfer protein VirB9 [Methylococcaceae bacterium]
MFKKTLIAIALLSSSSVMAAKVPTPGFVDSRIKTVIYDRRQVTKIVGHYGYSTHVVFGSSETIEDIVAGDSLGWSIIPGANKNQLTFKPTEELNHTNVTIVTNKHTYNFELDAHGNRSRHAKDLTFEVYFKYPEDEMKAGLARAKLKQQKKTATISTARNIDPTQMNTRYSRKGSEEFAPVYVFDSEGFTYFQFDESRKIPAIFVVEPDKSESLANFHREGPFFVVHSIGKQFALRGTNTVTCIYNDAWNPTIDSQLPETDGDDS